ncbi:hypothetical protein DFH09DRAFT_1075825 [Mycena vulgaris]|nr:hypothetical protein DFH09DRAFT_1075825 [Mycena vulgaris]
MPSSPEMSCASTKFLDLPVEMIAKILGFTIIAATPGSVNRTPWELGTVCKRLRLIAISLHALWSHIRIADIQNHSVEALETQLDRTGAAPSEFSSRTTQRWIGSQRRVTCSHRWTALTLHVGVWLLPHLAFIPGHIPQLQYLSFDINTPSRTHITVDLFSQAPALHHVSLPDHQRLKIPLPFLQLTYLSAVWDPMFHTEILSQMKNLQEATFHSLRGVQAYSSCSRICLPELHTLSGAPMVFFSRASLPRLRDLTITHALNARHFVDFSSGPAHNALKILRVTCGGLGVGASLNQILQCSPEVDTLSLCINQDDPDLLDRLGATMRHPAIRPWLGPSIAHLILHIEPPSETAPLMQGLLFQRNLIAMVESRMHVLPGACCVRLCSLKMRVKTLTPNTRMRLAALVVERDLDLSFF